MQLSNELLAAFAHGRDIKEFIRIAALLQSLPESCGVPGCNDKNIRFSYRRVGDDDFYEVACSVGHSVALGRYRKEELGFYYDDKKEWRKWGSQQPEEEPRSEDAYHEQQQLQRQNTKPPSQKPQPSQVAQPQPQTSNKAGMAGGAIQVVGKDYADKLLSTIHEKTGLLEFELVEFIIQVAGFETNMSALTKEQCKTVYNKALQTTQALKAFNP